jgi:hypothetical protein
MRIALLNMSSVPNHDMALIADAIKIGLTHVAEAWEHAPIDVAFMPATKVAPLGWAPLVAFEASDQPDAAYEGYHDLDEQGRPFGRAFRACIPGGAVLHDATGGGASLAAVLAHEAAEMVGDLQANAWFDAPFTDPTTFHAYSQVACELADPVQESTYQINVDGAIVDFSNFIYPAWFDRRAAGVQFDQMGVLKTPLTLAPGGYAIVRDVKPERQVFARLLGRARAPGVHKVVAPLPPMAWRESMKKLQGGRTRRRLRV